MKFLVRIILFLTLFLVGCTSTEECRENLTVALKIGVYSKTSVEASTLLTNKLLLVDSVWVNGLKKDSFLYNNVKSVSSLSLPLDISRTQSDFIVRFGNQTDTISIFYNNDDSYFISLACGCIVKHNLEEVVTTKHYIDSIHIINREIVNVDAEHIQLFHN
ncbi:MAG: hypothetical protein AUK44_05425 [Porphyromonadaceae bacterium CG2_30_38_12]|nr:MAG: hypothetical protein AUK44_05425 [Porphyromonadaceae bacterium CG2_30_38_12]